MKKNNTTHPDKTDQQIIQKLQDKGIIKGFHLELDYTALGYNIQTIIRINTQKDITNITEKYPENIITTHKTTRQYNTLLITQFKNITQLNTFLQTPTQDKTSTKQT